jgi:hypothetical protein
VSRPRIAFCVHVVVRIRCVLQGISPSPALRKQSWLQKGRKFLSEKFALPSENIAGIGMSPH